MLAADQRRIEWLWARMWRTHHYSGRGGVDFPQPDLTTCGGITAWMKIARLAEAHGLPVTSHGAHDLHVHLLAAVPNAAYLEVHGFGLERFIAQPLQMKDGRAIGPERPGHGIEFDRGALARNLFRGSLTQLCAGHLRGE